MNPTLEELIAGSKSRQKKPIPRGPIVIVVFFAFAVAMSLFAIYYNAKKMQRSLAFWGPADAQNIQMGSKVEFWDVKESGPASSKTTDGIRDENGPDDVMLTLDGMYWRQSNRRDVSKAKGLIHLRDALLDDFQYEWDFAMQPGEKFEPDRALVFHRNDPLPDKPNVTTVLIDSKKNIICSFRTNGRASSKKLVEAYLKVVESPTK